MEALKVRDHEPTRRAGSRSGVVARESTRTRATESNDRIGFLVIHPDMLIRTIIKATLGWTQWMITWTDNAETGWEALLAHRFDLVIMAHELPGLPGLNLLRRIRTHALPIAVLFIYRGAIPCEPREFDRLLKPGAALKNPLSSASLLDGVLFALSPPLAERFQ